MKSLFLAAFVALSFNANAQSDTSQVQALDFRLQQSGKELQKFYSMHMTGLSIAAAGSFVAATGYLGPEFDEGGRELVIGGSIIALAGIVTSIVANTHIKKAGIILTGNSVGVRIGK